MSLVPEDRSMPSIRSSFPTDTSPRHSKNLPLDSHGEMHAGYSSTNVASNASAPFTTHMSACSTPSPLPSQVPPAAPPPLNRNIQGQHNALSTTRESSPRENINPLGHRRKLIDEGKLRKICLEEKDRKRCVTGTVIGRIISKSREKVTKRADDSISKNLNVSSDFDIQMSEPYTIFKDMITAGMDTTTIIEEWEMAELVRNQRVQKKAHEELDRVIRKERVVTEMDFSNLPYMQCIVKEAFWLQVSL